MVIKDSVKRKLKNVEDISDSCEAKISKLEEPEEETVISTPPNHETNLKKDKQKSAFDIKHFRKELKSKKVQSVSLNQFLHVCTKGDNSIDYISLFLESGGSLNEILNQLDETNKKNTLLVNTVFSLLCLILKKIQSSSPQLLQSAEETCRYFLNSYVSTIDVMINDKSNAKQQRNTLKLLEAIVSFNIELGFTVLNQLTLQPKTLTHLVKYQSNKEKDSVRSSFISFILAFFNEKNTALIKTLLDKQGLIAIIFPELFKDNAETVLKILQILKVNIINNIDISKTIKIRTFNQHVLGCIFKLFNWKGLNSDKAIAGVQKSEIETSVTDFLLILCTSHKYGIYFTDKTLGTGDTPTSQFLWKTIESLEAPWNNARAGQLIIKMVASCPDLFRPVKNLVEQSFEPRISEQWLKTVTFLKDLLAALPAEHVINNMEELSPLQVTNFVRNVYLPIPILKMSSGALTSSDNSMRNEIILLLNVMLSSVKSYLILLNRLQTYSAVRPVLKNRLEDFIPKHFPSTDMLITVLHSVLDNTASEPAEDKSDSFKIPSPTKSKFLINILDLLLLYNDILPNSFDPLSTMLDSKRLFDKMETIDEVDKGELKLKITKFLLCADKYAFSPDKPLFKEILLSMFDVYISEDVTVSNEAKSVLHNILDTTGIFDKNRSEIDLILHTVHTVSHKHDNRITGIMVNIVEMTYLASGDYESLLVKHTKSGREDTTNIDINFDIFFENIENNTYQDKINLYQEKPCFTHFLLGLMEYRMKNADDNLDVFINYFILNLFHYQENVHNILGVLSKYKLDNSVQKYITSWAKIPIQLPGKITEKQSVLFKLSRALLDDEELSLTDIFNLRKVIDKDENIKYINLENTLELIESIDDPTVLMSWFHMILFYSTQLSSLGLWNDMKKKNATQAVCCVLEMIKNLSHTADELLSAVKLFLSNEIILNNFTPYGMKRNNCQKLITDFTLDILKFCFSRNIDENSLYHSLSPYRHKAYLSLMAQIKKSKKSKKGPTFDDLNNILSLINLSNSDASAVLNEILNLSVSCMISDENEASSWIFIVCHVVNQSIKNSNRLSLEIITKVANMYSKIICELDLVINVADLEESMYNYLTCFPEFINGIPHSVFKASFSVKHVGKYTSKLSALLLRANQTLLIKFNEHIVKEDVLGKRELVLPLTLAAFEHSKMNAFEDIINVIYNYYKSNIQKLIEKPHKATQIYKDNYKVVVQLIHRCMDVTECEGYMKKVHKFDSMEEFHVEILEALFLKTTFKQEVIDDFSFAENYLLNIIQLANISLKRDTLQYEKLAKVYTALENFLNWSLDKGKQASEDSENFAKVRQSPIWQNFFKSILKLYLKTTSTDCIDDVNENLKKLSLFDMVSHLIQLIYPQNDSDIENLFEMTTSHSEFLNIMLSTRHPDLKTSLVKLLYIMVSNNKNVMKSAHIPVYLSSYHATRCTSDQTILCLLRFYECNGQSMLEYQPYLWGEMAANHYAVRSKRKKSSLWSNPTVNHLLNLLDKDIIELTVKKFPIHARLNSEENVMCTQLFSKSTNFTEQTIDHVISNRYANNTGKNSSKNTDPLAALCSKMATNKHSKCLKLMSVTEFTNNSHAISESFEVYDPVFLLPVLNFILSPGSAVSCHRIVRCGVLAIPLAALSSDCPLIRAAAFNVLQRFYSHLEAEMYYKNDKLIWTQFIDTLKSSMESAISEEDSNKHDSSGHRLPSIGSLFMARAAFIMTRPLDPMFKPINNFVISKQYINFSVVPDLLDLFHNTDVQYLERRTWILEVLRDGIKNFSDIKVLLKSVAFKIILDFYSSNLSDNPTKLLLLEVINSSICIPRAAKILTEGYGLFAWLSNTFRNINVENKNLVSMSVTLISNLWLSLLCESIPKILSSPESKTNENKVDLIVNKCFKISETLHGEILCLLLDLLKIISSVSTNELITYLNVFRKISRSSLKNVSQFQILTLLKECCTVINCKQLKILSDAVENRKMNNVVTSQIVLTLEFNNSEAHIISKYLHEIVINWLF